MTTREPQSLREALDLLQRWTTEDVTGYCAACRHQAVMRGGKTPNVLDGQPHRKDCPIGQFLARAALSLPSHPEADAEPCWFCGRPMGYDNLIAGYDTWDEQRLACLDCDRAIHALREKGWLREAATGEAEGLHHHRSREDGRCLDCIKYGSEYARLAATPRERE